MKSLTSFHFSVSTLNQRRYKSFLELISIACVNRKTVLLPFYAAAGFSKMFLYMFSRKLLNPTRTSVVLRLQLTLLSDHMLGYLRAALSLEMTGIFANLVLGTVSQRNID